MSCSGLLREGNIDSRVTGACIVRESYDQNGEQRYTRPRKQPDHDESTGSRSREMNEKASKDSKGHKCVKFEKERPKRGAQARAYPERGP